jgi:subtilase family serine protease
MKSQATHSFSLALAAFALLLSSLVTGAIAADGQSSNMVLTGHTPREVQEGRARLVAHFDAAQKLRLVLGLRTPHPDEEEQFLRELQTKTSPNFHKFLTATEWNERFAPSAEDEQEVVDWATGRGFTITRRYPNRLLVDVEAPVSTIEAALDVQVNSYEMDGNSYFSNDRDPQIPASLGGIVRVVGGLNNIQVLRPANRNVKEPEFPVYSAGPAISKGHSPGDTTAGSKPSGAQPQITNGAYDPSNIWSSQAYDYQALYNQGHCCNPLGNPDNPPPAASIAIATAGTQNTNDFNGWAGHYGLWWHAFLYWIDGTPACCDQEGTMDYEWSSVMANSGTFADTAIVYMYDGANNGFSTFTDVFNAILTDGYARVLSTSWGCSDSSCYPQASMQQDHAIFNAMLGQGWTIIAAAGDQGAAAGGSPVGCGPADGVQYPASDPDVFAAGGTTLTLNANGAYVSEVGWSGGPDGCQTNDGGSTGGFSSFWATPAYQQGLGAPMRAVPDMALNADWFNTPQTLYFDGTFYTNCVTQGRCGGGTSIVAPELAGFFAQENAYLLYIGNIVGNTCGGSGNSPCAPLGDPHAALYDEYFNHYAPHYPFYDITQGCNNNNITAEFSLNFYCAGPGYDEVTGLGSANMLQLAWTLNWWEASDFGAPAITFSGPQTNKWYNTDQIVTWTVVDTSQSVYPPNGVAGFSQAWDSDPGDVYSEPTPGAGNSFYSGPQYPNYTAGCLDFTGARCAGKVGQGCHTVNVRAWDNTGLGSDDETYGPICYDTIPPVTKAKVQICRSCETATVTLTATDSGSGVASTWYKVGSATFFTQYTSPIKFSGIATYTVTFYSVDNAGNVEKAKSTKFTI